MKCHSCGASHMRKLSLVVEEGTRRTVSTGPRYTVHHTSQSGLAARHDVTKVPLATKVQIAYYSPAFVLVAMLAGKSLLVQKRSAWLGMSIQALAGLLACGALYLLLRFCLPGVHRRLVDARAVADQDMREFNSKWLCMSCGNTQLETE